MKRIIIIFIIILILIPSVAAQNVTIKGVNFEIPHQYEHGTTKDSSYMYENGLTFRILALDDSQNLRINYGSDINECNSAEQTTIAGHDVIVTYDDFENKAYTTVYFAAGDTFFLICFNDTYVNDDISGLIANAPEQNMSHDEFVNTLNEVNNDYQNQLAQEKAELDAEEYQRANKPENRYYFFWF